MEQRKTNSDNNLLIACLVGCGCLTGIAFLLVAIALFAVGVPARHVQKDHQFAQLIPSVAVGTDFNLYGKTLDNEVFDWESLRGKYVLVKFTATWCGPCKMAIPGLLESYEKYHVKGLEIVSVYIWEDRAPDPVAMVKQFVEQEKLPWIIISEELSKNAGQPPQGKFFGIDGVPTMVLIDREGKVLAWDIYEDALHAKLAEIFK